MDDAERKKAAYAASANEEQLIPLLHDPSPRVIKALLGNRNLREEDVLVIANRKNLPGNLLELIARDKRWTESYPIRLALAKNPKTPLSASLALVRYLRLFDIADLARGHLLPLAFRHKVEAIVTERIPTMPLGMKRSLARTAVGNILLKLMQDADSEVVMLCLGNPRMQEGHLFKIISREDALPGTIRLIAAHKNWSVRPLVRFALVRNDHTPLASSERFLQAMRLQDLRELHADPTLPAGVRPLVYRELVSRRQDPGVMVEERVFEVDEEDDKGLKEFEISDAERNKAADGE